MKPPIFVVGTMRSGSTLFRLILDSHPNIAIGEETGFMGALAATKAIPNWRYGKEWFGRIGWAEDELDARLRDFYSGMFERYAAEQGKPRWGEKTPFHSWHMSELARIFPDAVFVAIVRHPGAVVHSLRKRFHYEVREAAEYWENTNVEILRHGADLGDKRFAMIRYEDLVGAPEPTMRELLAWLDEPWSDDVLRHNEVQSAKGAPRVVDGNTSTREPIRAGRATGWTDESVPADLEVVEAVTRPLAGFLGYGTGPHAPGSPGIGEGLVLTGDMVARRARQYRDTVTLAPREPGVVVADMTKEELATRLRQAESSLARIRSRPVVRLSDTVRGLQRRVMRLSASDVLGHPARQGDAGDGRRCPACASHDVGRTGLTTEGRYRLLGCGRCRSQFFVDESDDAGDVASHYRWEAYKLDVYSDQDVRAGFEDRYAAMLERARSAVGELDTVLDVGCGIGNFVEFAERRGVAALGCEVSPPAVAEARRRGLRVHTPEELPTAVAEGSVDAMTMWDVIEHVSTPREFVSSTIGKVRPGGAILFETPDGGFPIRRWLLALNRTTRGRVDLTGPMYYWEHKVYLTEQGLRALLDEVGADIVHVERQTSVRAKMRREFAVKRSRKGRLLRRGWPVLETVFRRAGWGNKLLVVARRRES